MDDSSWKDMPGLLEYPGIEEAQDCENGKSTEEPYYKNINTETAEGDSDISERDQDYHEWYALDESAD